MAVLWIVLAVVGLTGALVVFKILAGVLAAARQLQRNVETLGKSVTAELERLGADVDTLGDSVDETRRR
jgi:hypothetical protein